MEVEISRIVATISMVAIYAYIYSSWISESDRMRHKK